MTAPPHGVEPEPASSAEPAPPVEPGRAARLYHALSSFGWFTEPPPPAGPVVGSAPPRPAPPEALAGFAALLAARTSQREFTGAPITADELLALAWCGYGRVDGSGSAPRATVASAGGLLALRLVALPLAVTGLDRPARVFDPAAVAWRPVGGPGPDRPGDWFRTRHIDYDRAAVVFVVTVELDEPVTRYGERGYRYALLEAGHVVQNLCLAATALGLGAVEVGGFDDERVNDALRDQGVALAAVAVGQVGPGSDPGAAEALVARIRPPEHDQ